MGGKRKATKRLLFHAQCSDSPSSPVFSHQPTRMGERGTMTTPQSSVPNSPIDREIMVLSGFGFTFMLSTMARMGLKVLLAMSEGFTDHRAFLPFTFPGMELLPPTLTCTSRTEGRSPLPFISITYGSITSKVCGGRRERKGGRRDTKHRAPSWAAIFGPKHRGDFIGHPFSNFFLCFAALS